MRRLFLTVFAGMLAGAVPANALVLWGLDNTANRSDPGTGAPWGAVAKVVNASGSLLSGSAVYLGNGYLLTANHVTMDLTYSFVTFDQVEFFSIDPTFNDGVRSYGKQIASGVDMAVFKLTSIPVSATAATMLSSASEQVASATLIGWGVGRDPSIPVASTNVTWGDATTSDKRWGVNEPKFSGTNPYAFIGAIAGATGAEFDPDGLGDSEASATLYDSGSGLFQKIGSNWYLIGLTTAVEGGGSSVYGNDTASGSGRGTANYFVRVSGYDEQVTALIPEPSTVSLLALAGATLAWTLIRRHRRG